MVSALSEDDRGQLLLIGALAVALVILGTVVMLNGMKFTDTIGSQGNDGALIDAERTSEMLETDLARLTERVRADTKLVNFGSALKDNVSTLGTYYTGMSIGQGSVYLNVSLDTTGPPDGQLIEQTSTRTFQESNRGGDQNWTIARGASFVDPFNVTLDGFPNQNARNGNFDMGKRSSFAIEVTGDGGTEWRLKFNSTRDPARMLTVYEGGVVETSYTSDATPWFDTTGEIDVDLTDGCVESVPTGREHCGDAFRFQDDLDAPYDVSLNNTRPPGKFAEGTFRFASDTTTVSTSDSRVTVLPVVEPTFNVTYQRPEVAYTERITIEGDDP